MPTGYGNDKNNEGNSHNEDVDSTDFKANWKIYLIFFFKWGPRVQNGGWEPRTEGRGKPRPLWNLSSRFYITFKSFALWKLSDMKIVPNYYS